MNIQYIQLSLLNFISKLRHLVTLWDVKKPQYKLSISLGVFDPETNIFHNSISEDFEKQLNNVMSDYVDWDSVDDVTETHVYEYIANKELVETSVVFSEDEPDITHKVKHECSHIDILSMGNAYDMQLKILKYYDTMPPRVITTLQQQRMDIVCNNSYKFNNGWNYVFSNICTGKTRTEAEMSDRMNNNHRHISIEFTPTNHILSNMTNKEIVHSMISNIQSIYDQPTISECVLLELS